MVVPIVGVNDLDSINIVVALFNRDLATIVVIKVCIQEVHTLVLKDSRSLGTSMSHWLLKAYSLETDHVFRTLAELPSRGCQRKDARRGSCISNKLPVCPYFLDRRHQGIN